MKSKPTILRRILMAVILVLLALGVDPTPLLAQPANVVKPLFEKANDKVYIIKVTGEVDDIMAKSIERRSDIAVRGGATLIVYEIDSPGGLLGSMLTITSYIRDRKVPTVAWIHDHAFSAASMIALSCGHVVVSDNTLFGDCGVIAISNFTGELTQLDEHQIAKFSDPILKDVELSAQKNGFPVDLAHAMILRELEVYEMTDTLTPETRFVADPTERQKLLDKTVQTPNGELKKPWKMADKPLDDKNSFLIVNADEAIKTRLAQARVNNVEDLRAVLNISTEPTFLDYTFAEEFARWLGSWWVRAMLIFLMLIFAYVEFTHPGTLFGGIAALVCLVLVVAAPYMAGLAQAWEIGLIILGVAIVIIDLVFAGGIGMAAIPGFLLMAVGIIGTFVPADPGGSWFANTPQTYAALQHGTAAMVFGTLAAVGGFFIMAKYLYMTPGFRRLQLKPALATTQPTVQDASEASAGEAVFAGALGKASTDLRPAGKARFGDHLVDVVTEGQFIRAGETIVVLEANATRVVVKPYQDQSAGAQST